MNENTKLTISLILLTIAISISIWSILDVPKNPCGICDYDNDRKNMYCYKDGEEFQQMECATKINMTWTEMFLKQIEGRKHIFDYFQ